MPWPKGCYSHSFINTRNVTITDAASLLDNQAMKPSHLSAIVVSFAPDDHASKAVMIKTVRLVKCGVKCQFFFFHVQSKREHFHVRRERVVLTTRWRIEFRDGGTSEYAFQFIRPLNSFGLEVHATMQIFCEQAVRRLRLECPGQTLFKAENGYAAV
ncbi:heterokaryon incompatibility protein [Colletotrichum asianum]